MSNTYKDTSKRRGHRSSKEYANTPIPKLTAVGRRKQCGHSYICPCCMKDSRSKFKVHSHRLIRRTFIIAIEEE